MERAIVGNPEESASSERTTQFIKLLTSHQPQVYAYVVTMMLGDSAAADVLQDTNLHLWAQADQYDFDRPFLPWAFGFARQRVRAYRKTCVRSRLVFSDEALDILNGQLVKASDSIDDRLSALQKCLAQLSSAQAELVRDRYIAKTPVKAIASRMDDSAHNISTRLHRIRKILANCVERNLTVEGR